jgi:DNA-binding NarL/FixJ family response regulator
MKTQNPIPKINCNDCLKRPSCTSLCPAAEAYASQDHVPGGRELLVHSTEYVDNASPWPDNEAQSTVKMSDKYIVILALLNSGVPRKIIQKNLGLTAKQLANIIHKIKKKME